MVLISLEGFNERDRFQVRGGYLDDVSPLLSFGDMEDIPVGVKIMWKPLYQPPVSKPNDDLILYSHQDTLPFPPEKLNSNVADYPRKINILMFAVSHVSREEHKTETLCSALIQFCRFLMTVTSSPFRNPA